MEVEVTIASDRSAAGGMCARTSSGDEAPFNQRTIGARGVLPPRVRVDVRDTLLDWADTEIDADITENLRSLSMTRKSVC